jgi:RNA polymerase-binding transcription factor DksA
VTADDAGNVQDAPARRVRLEQERANVAASMLAISADLVALVASAADSNGDDEHDPEGATIAYERAQLSSLLDEARASLASIEEALARIDSGSYGACQRCGEPIGDERISALPSTTICFNCASTD